ncbi:hypothetical protein LTR54_006914 [Friedmanniomyces endolithicus]|nr:hypothetical protein LTR54_006914 [Friedmanniomyces endolithicus]
MYRKGLRHFAKRRVTAWEDYFFALAEELYTALQRVKAQTQDNLSLRQSIQRNVAKPYCAILEGRFQQNQDLQRLLTTVAGEDLITTATAQLDSTQPFFAPSYDAHLCRARTTVIQHWGAEVVFYYGWHTQSKNFTDRLRTLAKKYTWTEATKRINLAISESCRTGGSQRDLTAQHRRVVDSDLRKVLILDTLLPTGLAQYDVDQYGILCKWHSWRATEGQSSQYGSAGDEARAEAAAEAAPEMAVEEAGEARQRGVGEPTTRSGQDRRANSRGEEPKGDTEAGASVGVESAVIQERAEAVCAKPGEKQREIQHMTEAAQYAKDKEKEDETSPTGSPDEEEVRSDAEAQWDEEEAGAEEEEDDEETAQRGGADGEEDGLEAERQVDGEEIDTEEEADDEVEAAEADADNTQSPTSSTFKGDVSESDRAYQTRETTPEDYTQDRTLPDQLRSAASARQCSTTAGQKRRRQSANKMLYTPPSSAKKRKKPKLAMTSPPPLVLPSSQQRLRFFTSFTEDQTPFLHLTEKWQNEWRAEISAFQHKIRSCLDVQLAMQGKPTSTATQLDKACADWIGEVVFAEIGYIEPGGALPTAEEVDVYVVSYQAFEFLSADERWCPNLPVLILGEPFSDAGCVTVESFLRKLQRTHKYFPKARICVQNPHDPSRPKLQTAEQIIQSTSRSQQNTPSLDKTLPQHATNLLDIHADVANLAAPRATHLDRFQVLHCLGTSGITGKQGSFGEAEPGSQQPGEPDDLYTTRFLRLCLRFTILGFISAFSGGHCDVLNGTWLRCVEGKKAWIVASGLTTEDLVEWANTANRLTWCPHGKTRIIILKEGDTLWMPPGVIVVHAPLTLRDCLMTGGMIWDSLRMRNIANNIEFISAHDTITNEDVPANLAKLAQTAAEMEEGRIEMAEE